MRKNLPGRRHFGVMIVVSVIASMSQAVVVKNSCLDPAFNCLYGGKCNPISKICDCNPGYAGNLCESCTTFRTRGRLDLSEIGQNNLGNLGPDKGEPILIFKQVGKTSDNQTLDLQIQAKTKYVTFKPESNGIGSTAQFGQINVAVEVSKENKGRVNTVLEFTFVDNTTQKPAMFEFFTFGVFDLDQDKLRTLRETVCVDLDQIVLRDSRIPGLELKDVLGELQAKVIPPKTYPDAGLLPGYKQEQVLSDYKPGATCIGSTKTRLGSVEVLSNQVGFPCDSPTLAFEDARKVFCSDCFNKKQCSKKKVTQYFGPIYGKGAQKGQTCKDIAEADCTDTSGIDTSTRSFTLGFTRTPSFRLSFGLTCNKPVGESCTRNVLFGGLMPGCVICNPGFVPDGTGLCKVICFAPNYIVGKRCLPCPAGSTCDGTKATVCPSPKYVTNNTCASCPAHRYIESNTCKACPTGHTCDGTKATVCPGPKYVDGNECRPCTAPRYIDGDVCTVCPAGFTCNGTAISCPGPRYLVNNTCVPCPAHRYIESHICKACPSGHTCDGTAATKCSATRYIRDNLCQPCPKGSTCNGVVATVCPAPNHVHDNVCHKPCPASCLPIIGGKILMTCDELSGGFNCKHLHGRAGCRCDGCRCLNSSHPVPMHVPSARCRRTVSERDCIADAGCKWWRKLDICIGAHEQPRPSCSELKCDAP